MLPPGFSLLAYPPPYAKVKQICFSNFPGETQRPRWGRSAGPHFSPMRNGGKNRLGRSPLRTSLGYEAAPAAVLRPGRRASTMPRGKHALFFSIVAWKVHVSPDFGPFWSTRPTAAGNRPHTAKLEALAMEGKSVSGVGIS